MLVERLETVLDARGGLKEVRLVLADQRVFSLDDTLRISPANRLYVTLEQLGLEALLARGPFFELARFLDQDQDGYFIPVAGKRYYIRSREETRTK